MNIHTGKSQENASRAVANTFHGQAGQAESATQLGDVKQSELQEIANQSPRVRQLRAYQEMADNRQRAKQAEPADNSPAPVSPQVQRKENKTGLPDTLKSGIENLSGYSMDDVTVHFNSSKPAQLQALAYAQGTDIHVAPGQEKHLPHEAWHVVQQKQGRVKPTVQTKGVPVNSDAGLEKEADEMGAKAFQLSSVRKDGPESRPVKISSGAFSGAQMQTVQRVSGQVTQDEGDDEVYLYSEVINESFGLPPGQGVAVGDIVSFDLDESGNSAEAGTVNGIAPPGLNRNAVENEVGNWGDVTWKTNWSLNRPAVASGWVIQDVIAEEHNESPTGEEREESCVYQEAWKLNAGDTLTEGFIQDTIEQNRQIQEALNSGADEAEIDEDPYDDDTGPTLDEHNYEGSYLFRGSARFYEGFRLPGSFIVNNDATWAGPLHSRLGSSHDDLADGRASAPNDMTLQFEWSPYTEDGLTQVTQLMSEEEERPEAAETAGLMAPPASGPDVVQRVAIKGEVQSLPPLPPVQMVRGEVVLSTIPDDDEVYIYSEEIDESFAIPVGVNLSIGDQINFELEGDKVIAESIEVIGEEVVYGLPLLEATFGGAFKDTVGGAQRSSEDLPACDGVVAHLSIVVADPTQMHLSFYPADDADYLRKILDVRFTWNTETKTFGASGVVRGIWKPFKDKYGLMTTWAEERKAGLQSRLRDAL
ncbi:DUF4157 domain-containing protein [Daejeonella sp. JGW-45]|uniref:eCIS core domain-containing protein n=1 Tax=Daejeonella sp. JGW-45 TaxID=3034148 RepID=UPI0023ED57AD|nr:DUF4157 domain-containing protein [Daejeonella sp. JGW-45]